MNVYLFNAKNFNVNLLNIIWFNKTQHRNQNKDHRNNGTNRYWSLWLNKSTVLNSIFIVSIIGGGQNRTDSHEYDALVKHQFNDFGMETTKSSIK